MFNREKRGWLRGLLKAFIIAAIAVVIFAGGFRIGRGSWHIHQAPAASQPLDYSSLSQVYSLLKNNFNGSLDNTKLINGAKAGLVDAAGDPFTEYFNPEQAKNFNSQLSNSIEGIGAELSKSGDNIIVMSPIAGYPAAKAGSQAKDVILAVNSKVVTGADLQSVVDQIRGPAGTKVTLTIIRGKKQFNVTITRQKISLPDVTYKIEGKIGYMQIIEFSNNTVSQAQAAAAAFNKAGVKAVVLDLRDNPGGYLQGAVDVSSLWLKQGQEVVQERRGSQVVDTLYANGNDILHGLPTIVIVNGGSASASEITAAALRDNSEAKLLGTTSFGKGSVQELDNLSDGGELKVTVALWYTPNGQNVNQKGLKPDYVVQPGTSGKDTQKAKAEQILSSQISN